ncbi:ribonuclease H-like domain-containing protein [Lasiosphaeria hispida]|uniref:Ribonuclease H-like domain-containing protein n=1 Tax=Lasiosphaeria hispida TaxID=260671 RepID=A0AAJ0MFR8_9PEZI|nr:ribonuclease H-like domain-containing protein [Lasiosphaeria hispida]
MAATATVPVALMPPPVAFAQSADYAEALASLLHTLPQLQRAGYVVQRLSQGDLERKKRCGNCNTRCLKYSDKQLRLRPSSESTGRDTDTKTDKDKTEVQETLRCKFHPGKYIKRKWTCCGDFGSAKPCSGAIDHKVRAYGNGELEGQWQFHHTPAPAAGTQRRAAVAIDCEMGTTYVGDSELIRLSVVDYFSGDVLVDKLVFPNVKMKHYNTKYSGVTPQQMDKAHRRGQCLMGKGAARKEVWKFVGPSTIVVGHGAQNDLSALRWIHHRVVDSFLVENAIARKQAEAEELAAKLAAETTDSTTTTASTPVADAAKKPQARGEKGGLSLKALVKRRLDRDIQMNGKNGHDSLEDAIAAKDLVHFHIVALLMNSM